MNKTYKEKLQRQFLKNTLIPLVISFVIFSALLAAYIFSYTRLNLNRWSELAEQKVRDIYTYGCGYLTDEETLRSVRQFMAGDISQRQMTRFFRTTSYDAPTQLDMLLLDRDGGTLYYSGEENDYSSFLVYYNQLLGLPASQAPASKVYSFKQTGTTKWLLNCVLTDENGDELGQMILLMDESALINSFRSTGYEVVLTNDSNLAAMSTSQSLLDSRHFFPYDGGSFSAAGVEYAVERTDAPELEGYIYTLCAMQDWTDYYIVGLAILVLLAAILLAQSGKLSLIHI